MHPRPGEADALQSWQEHSITELFGGMLPALVITALVGTRWGKLAAVLRKLTGREDEHGPT